MTTIPPSLCGCDVSKDHFDACLLPSNQVLQCSNQSDQILTGNDVPGKLLIKDDVTGRKADIERQVAALMIETDARYLLKS